MISPHASASRFDLRALLGAAVLCAAVPAGAAPYYAPITPSMNDRTVTLNGHDLMLRIERFRNPFFTGVAASDVLPGVSHGFFDYAPVDLEQEIQSLMNPVAPFGSAIVGTVEDLQAQRPLNS
jgi:hypothetical protein